ncbi:MAG: hypothetical protein QJR02_11315 [Sinobacteraceae bacterium]|nr:hypothetical protein [Nevskiaceae bacterium]
MRSIRTNAVRLLSGIAVLGVLTAMAVLALGHWQARDPAPPLPALAASGCPAGYQPLDPVEVAREFHPRLDAQTAAEIRARLGATICLSRHFPESLAEVGYALNARENAAAAPLPYVPEGAFRRAVEQKAALVANPPKVAGADGTWTPYGAGTLIANDCRFPAVCGQGFTNLSGRVDSFAYDPVGHRLFAAVGTGGVWMSQASMGDVRSLANQWTPVGDGLPTLAVSAIAWTPADPDHGSAGGTLLALTGEDTQGGNSYVGLGAYWSNDLGTTWHHASGVPDGAFAFKLAVDPAYPNIVYAATGKGLYRSEDAGRSYVDVKLPTKTLDGSSCAGRSNPGDVCQLANFVTDVVVKAPGGSTNEKPGAKGSAVLAAVGYRAGAAPYQDGKGTPQSMSNGLYRSDDGTPGSFQMLQVYGNINLPLPNAFAPQLRVGRVELGAATGATQNHNVVYAVVEDAVLFNGGFPILDLPPEFKAPTLPCQFDPTGLCALLKPFSATTFNGVYVSSDFGSTWTRLADDTTTTYDPVSGSSLALTVGLGVGAGVQSWYDEWIKPDPTRDSGGVPTRVLFGLEEVWRNRLTSLPMDASAVLNPSNFEVIGTYFAGNRCLFLIGNIGVGGITPTLPICPTSNPPTTQTTTHPDQHDGIFIPTTGADGKPDGGVCLFVGNDGGVFRQCVAAGGEIDNAGWGDGANSGFHSLFHYGFAVAKDGTVYAGDQDNGTMKIEPGSDNSFKAYQIYVGDGVFAEVDPDDSKTAYYETPDLALVVTTDGGTTTTDISPPATNAYFISPFVMDPSDAKHLLTGGTEVFETTAGPATTSSSWTQVFTLGVGPNNEARSMRALALSGDAAYVGFCGPCNVISDPGAGFQRGIATNVGGDKPPKRLTGDGWHFASLNGLPNRYIYWIAIDPSDASGKTIYVALGGYSPARWLPPGQYLDKNSNIGSGHVFKSTDAGEHFTDISGNLPDVNATSIAVRNSQIVLGTELGPFISSDTDGTSWAPLGSGLPNVAVTQVRFKPGDPDTLFASTFGRGMWTYRFASGGSSSGGSSGGSTSGGSTSGGSSSGSGSSSGGTSSGASSGGGSGGGALPPLVLLGLGMFAIARRIRRF